VSLFGEGYNVSNLEAAGLNAPVVYDPSSVRRGGTTSGLGFSGSPQGPADVNAPFGTFAVGTRFVPKTGLFQLHQGEEVRNRGEVRQDRNRQGSKLEINLGGITIKGSNKSPEQLASEIVRPLRKELIKLDKLLN